MEEAFLLGTRLSINTDIKQQQKLQSLN